MAKPDRKNSAQSTHPDVAKVGRFIAVASGKGGVGKTAVAVNLASAAPKRGLRVGLSARSLAWTHGVQGDHGVSRQGFWGEFDDGPSGHAERAIV